MILLADWAQFRNSGSSLHGDDEELGTEEYAGVTDVTDALIDNLQMASRYALVAKVRASVQARLDEVTAKLVGVMNDGLVHARQDLDEKLKILFSPLLNDRLESKAIEDFCDDLVVALGKDAARQLVVAAPAELHERLAVRLGVANIDASLVPAEGAEISTTIATTEITTEIGKWKADLQRLLS
jgi:hypothetical protein